MKPREIPIFNNEYKVVVCWGNAKFITSVLKEWHHTHDMETVKSKCLTTRGVCYYGERVHPVIALPKRPVTPEEIGTLAHEATHAISDIFDKLSEDYKDECYAISVGAVVRETLRK